MPIVAGAERTVCQKTNPYLLPSFSTFGAGASFVLNAIRQAKDWKIVILTVYGVPDDAHAPVKTQLQLFEFYLNTYTITIIK